MSTHQAKFSDVQTVILGQMLASHQSEVATLQRRLREERALRAKLEESLDGHALASRLLDDYGIVASKCGCCGELCLDDVSARDLHCLDCVEAVCEDCVPLHERPDEGWACPSCAE
jgi:hypothetical protein